MGIPPSSTHFWRLVIEQGILLPPLLSQSTLRHPYLLEVLRIVPNQRPFGWDCLDHDMVKILKGQIKGCTICT